MTNRPCYDETINRTWWVLNNIGAYDKKRLKHSLKIASPFVNIFVFINDDFFLKFYIGK